MPVTFSRIDVGIDAAAEQIVKIGIKRLPLQNSAADLIPGKGREMAHIKNKRMTPDDRFVQQILAANQRKDLIRARPCRNKLLAEKLCFVVFAAS